MKIAIKTKNLINGINDEILKNKVIRIDSGYIKEIVNFSPY